MLARDLMTREVATVSPETPVGEIARLLLERGISAVPVVDASGMPIGMVSEGDLVGRDEAAREARRDWWLALLAEGEELHPDFLHSLRRDRTAHDVMAAPVVRVTETTPAAEVARVLKSYRIKRVPVVRDGRIVGIVSRADLLRGLAEPAALAAEAAAPRRSGGLIADIVETIEAGFAHSEPATPPAPGAVAAAEAPGEGEPSAQDFRALVADSEQHKVESALAARRQAAERRRQQVKALIDRHIADDDWRALLHRAREAAEHGAKEMLLLRFPSGLCTDGGRAINAPLPDWPQTLRGEAAEVYLRWRRDLKRRGFHLAARVLDFPDSQPGDIGLFLLWGE